MKYILHVENSPTPRAGVRGLCRRLPGIELVEALTLEAARREIRLLAPRVFGLAILDWSLPDGRAHVLLPLLACRIVILSACPPVVPGVVIIPKEGNWRRLLEVELRK